MCVFGAGMTLWCGLMMFDGQPSYYPATQMSVLQLARPAHAHCSSLPLRWKKLHFTVQKPNSRCSALGKPRPYITFKRSAHVVTGSWRCWGRLLPTTWWNQGPLKGGDESLHGRNAFPAEPMTRLFLIFLGVTFASYMHHHSESFTSTPRLETCHFTWQERQYTPVEVSWCSDLMFTTGINRHLLHS